MTTITGIPSSQPTLSFPRETFAKLSPHPYLLAHLQPSDSSTSLRANGRSPAQFRAPHINNGSLTNAEGSAVVRLGDTTAVCGIRGEILLATNVPDYRVDKSSSLGASSGTYNEAKELDLLVPNIELATGCSPAFLPGQPPSSLAQSLSTRIYSLLHSSRLIDTEDLRIWHQAPLISATEKKGSDDEEDENEISEREVKAFWTLYIDILFISLDGNPFDTAWAAVLSALRDVRLPFAYWDIDRQMILCSDEFSQSKKLNLRGIPIACTYAIFQAKEHNIQVRHGEEGDGAKYWVLADPDTFEESLCEEKVTVVVDRSQPGEATRVLGISKSGGSVVGRREMRELVEMASKRWGEWHGVLTTAKVS
jgi:exosome complex component RRP43